MRAFSSFRIKTLLPESWRAELWDHWPTRYQHWPPHPNEVKSGETSGVSAAIPSSLALHLHSILQDTVGILRLRSLKEVLLGSVWIGKERTWLWNQGKAGFYITIIVSWPWVGHETLSLFVLSSLAVVREVVCFRRAMGYVWKQRCGTASGLGLLCIFK